MTIRAFIAIGPPEGIRRDLAMLQALLPLPRRLEPEDFHLTLAFLGDQPEPVLEALHDGLSGLAAAQFSLTLEGAGLFGGVRPRVIWAGVAESALLRHLQARVARVAVQAGIPVATQGFNPHVTLGRAGALEPDQRARLEAAVAAAHGFRAGPWQVEAIGLYASYPARKGARYDLLADYPLTERASGR
jgi:2'-5' RNA ligase